MEQPRAGGRRVTSLSSVESSAYNAGVRASTPIELVVDFKYAIELGVVFFLSESDVMLTADIVPNDAILYYTDAQTGEVLWRNALRLEALESQTTVDSLAARRAVTVTADEAFQTDAEGNRATNPEDEQTNEDMAVTRPGPIPQSSGSRPSPRPSTTRTVASAART